MSNIDNIRHMEASLNLIPNSHLQYHWKIFPLFSMKFPIKFKFEVELESRCWILYMVSGPLTVLFVDLAKERPITMLVDCLLVASWQFLFWFVAKFAVLDILKMIAFIF